MSREIERINNLPAITGDVMEEFFFNNGRGISVIRHSGSGGYRAGLFEVAVLKPDGDIDYSTEVLPEGVEGWLTAGDVIEVARKINELPPIKSALEGKNIPQIEV